MTTWYSYRIRVPDGLAYIGITEQQPPQQRFADHRRAETLIGHAIRHYGLSNRVFDILREGSEFDIRDFEGRAIRFYNTRYPAGYNFAPPPDTAEARAWFQGVKLSAPQRQLNDPSTDRDAIFAPAMSLEKRSNSGWIEMTANTAGMRAIQRIFPEWAFGWEPLRDPWKGWRSTVSHLPSLAAACGRSVRSELIGLNRLQSLDDAQLASLMAHAAHVEGARAAWFATEDKVVHPFFRRIQARTACHEAADEPTTRVEKIGKPVLLHYAPEGNRQPCLCSMILPSQSRSSL